MCRTGMCRFGLRNWIFLVATLHLFTYAQGTDDTSSEEIVQITTEPSDVVSEEGGVAALRCAATPPAPRTALHWRHSPRSDPTRDHVISKDDKYRRQLPNGTLVVGPLTAETAGQYQCVAELHSVGTVLSRVATVFLAALPQVSGGPRVVSAVAGSPAALPCPMSAEPRVALRVVTAAALPRTASAMATAKERLLPPTLRVNVTWTRRGRPVSPAAEGGRISISGSGALELEPATPSDADSYRCRVALPSTPHLYTEGPEVELRVSPEVSTEYPPRFVTTPASVTVIEGATVTFDCAAVGNPRPEIIWLNNGVAIDLGDLDSRVFVTGGALRVWGARPADGGTYTCRAHNRLDSADHTASLRVLSAPRVSVPSAVVRARVRGDVTLRCAARARPPPAVTWLKNGEPLTPNNHDIAIVDGSSLRIQGVLRSDAGMLQCAARSPAGNALAAVRLVVMAPDQGLNTSKRIDPVSVLSSLAPDTPYLTLPHPATKENHPQTPEIHVQTPKRNKTYHDILNSLVSSSYPEQSLDLDSSLDSGVDSPEELDFLGETSSAYTSHPEEYDDQLQSLDVLSWAVNASAVSAPRALRAQLVKPRFAALRWEPPATGAPAVQGYLLLYTVAGHTERERVWQSAGPRLETNVAGLQPDTQYSFTVAAYADSVLSPPSQPVAVRTPAEEWAVGAPREVRAAPAGPHALHVTWNPPHTGHQINYTVHYTEAESGREQVQWVESSSLTHDAETGRVGVRVGGLRAAAAYWVRVSAAGGAASAEVRGVTTSDVPAAPPANVTAAATSDTSIVVSWDPPPPRTHRGPLTGYKLRYRPAPPEAPAGAQARRKADSLTTPADARRAELTQLDPGTTYQIRVCALNANGSGPFSEWVWASTKRPPAPETRLPAKPPPLTTRAGRDWISVWWSGEESPPPPPPPPPSPAPQGGAVRSYWLGWGLGVPDTHSVELPAARHSHLIRRLESNSEYVISLRAGNSLGLGPAVYATVRTRPPADGEGEEDEEEEEGDEDELEDEDEQPPLIPPVGLKVIMLSGTTAVVYWTDATLPKGQTATDGRRYVVRWSAAGGGRARHYNATDLNCMVDELRPYTDYEFAVKLIKGGRESAWSMVVTNRTLEALPGSPPRDVRAAPGAPPAKSVELAWAPPARPNGLVTGYIVMYAIARPGSSEASGDWTAVTVAGDRGRSRIDRLRPRTTYLVKVQARNSKGLGPFSAPITFTTAVDTGEGGGLAAATSAWLWASAGGACAVLALAAALALSLCCRRSHRPMSPGTSTYQKSSASAALKPPDLWIHHDQMELKHMDKSMHSSASKISAGSVEGGLGGGTMSSTLTLGRGAPAEYEAARHHHHAPPASLDRRHYVPTYVEGSCSGSCGSADTLPARPPAPAPAPALASHYRHDLCCDYTPMTGLGVGVGCAATCDRRLHRPAHEQLSALSGGCPGSGSMIMSNTVGGGHMGGGLSPHASLASLAPLHHAAAMHTNCGGSSCPTGPSCAGGAPSAGPVDIYASAARERGHYVAYEPLGHYTHRDSVSSEAGAAGAAGASVCAAAGSLAPTIGIGAVSGGAGGSLGRPQPAGGQPQPAGGRPQHAGGPLHSFSDSDHSTPTHSNRSVRESSPYKKSAASSPTQLPSVNRLLLGGAVSHTVSETEPLTPSRSTERLHREMQNLEGLMRDLSDITKQHRYH